MIFPVRKGIPFPKIRIKVYEMEEIGVYSRYLRVNTDWYKA
jgi:hypothetical protein